MSEEEVVPHILYGDGTNEVAVTSESIMLSDAHGIVLLSRAAFREVVLAWERHLAQEAEA
jgi:hypothetical protein